MAWEWPHSTEGLAGARERLEAQNRQWLEVCYAEVRCATPDGSFRALRYAQALVAARQLPADTLADTIWRDAEQRRSCDNGGHHLWMCPWGCHTVAPEPLEEAR